MRRLIVEVRKLTSKYPNYTYEPPEPFGFKLPKCSYTRGGDPNYPEMCGCLFGQAVRNAGLDIHLVEGMSISSCIRNAGLDAPRRWTDWADTVQFEQDTGDSWSEAVQRADRRHLTKAERLIWAIRDLATACPDFRYTPSEGVCSNHRGGDSRYPEMCGCIVGQAFKRAFPDIEMKDGYARHFLQDTLGVDAFTEKQLGWVSTVQRGQDRRFTWSEAISNADEWYTEVDFEQLPEASGTLL